MTIQHTKMAATNMAGIKSIELRDAYTQASASAEVTCTSHSVSIGDTVNISMGTDLNYAQVMTGGIVRKILTRAPDFDYVVTVLDKLCLAADYFIASDDPNKPYQASKIKAEDLVVYMLGLASISGVDAHSTIFTYGTAAPVPINLVSAWSMVDTISRVCGFATYCDAGGTVHFLDRKPYITGADTVSAHSYTTGDTGDLLAAEYDRNTEGLLNRVVVYGGAANQIHSSVQASSPYLPPNFYKTLVVAHPLIDSQVAADATAALNLTMFNRLTETVSLTVFGNPLIRTNSIVDATEGFTGLNSSELWLVNGSTLTISNSGFVQRLTLVR